MTLGRVKASDRKITSGYWSCTSRIIQRQKSKGLVCGLSTRNVWTPCSTQKITTPSSSSQRASQASQSKSIGKMSWYFFGGFSA